MEMTTTSSVASPSSTFTSSFPFTSENVDDVNINKNARIAGTPDYCEVESDTATVCDKACELMSNKIDVIASYSNMI